MCEDRATQSKRGSSARLARIQHSHLRTRVIRVRNPARDSPPSSPIHGGDYHQPSSPTPGVHIPNFTYQFIHQQNANEQNEEWYKYRTVSQTKRDNLTEIAMRTVMLMRQNQQLQQKLAALQAETRMFVRSVNEQQRANLRVQIQAPRPQIKVEAVIDRVIKAED